MNIPVHIQYSTSIKGRTQNRFRLNGAAPFARSRRRVAGSAYATPGLLKRHSARGYCCSRHRPPRRLRARGAARRVRLRCPSRRIRSAARTSSAAAGTFRSPSRTRQSQCDGRGRRWHRKIARETGAVRALRPDPRPEAALGGSG